MLPKNIPTFDFTVDGKEYRINFSDFTGSEARLFRQQVGVALIAALTAVEQGGVDPLELVAGFKWIVDRRDNPEADFDKILDSLSYDSVSLTAEGEEEEDPPTPGGDSETSSPPSLATTASGPGR